MARKKTLPPGWKGSAHMPASPQQIRTIHALKRQLDMDDGPYRDMIARHGQGVCSSKDLSRAEASKVIMEMANKLHGAEAEPVTTQGNVTALATPPQRALIGHLSAEINWYAHGSYDDWLRKNMGLDKIVTKEEASRVIEGLKGLKRHGHAAARPVA